MFAVVKIDDAAEGMRMMGSFLAAAFWPVSYFDTPPLLFCERRELFSECTSFSSASFIRYPKFVGFAPLSDEL